MSNIVIVIFAYLIDKYFKDFSFKLHPIDLIREWIEFFEEKFYKDSVSRGVLLVLFMLGIVAALSVAIQLYLIILPTFIYIIASSLIASIFITSQTLSEPETEAYNIDLRDTLIAPLFYLLLFNLPGIIIYKTINTMHSMLASDDTKYTNYAKATNSLDNIMNYIPSKIISILMKQRSKMVKNENI